MRLFENGSPSAEVLLKWWKDLQDNPGKRANLKRCAIPVETIYIPTSHKLLNDLQKISNGQSFVSDKVCAIAGLLAHVKENNPAPFAKQISQKKPGSDLSVISDIRFRRLLQYSNISQDDLFFQNMIRIIRHLNRVANIPDLFSSLYFWGDNVKKRWAYAYYSSMNLDEK